MPIDPTMLTQGVEWNIGGVGGLDEAGAASGSGGASFGSMLGEQLGSLSKLQNEAADASRSLADGTAVDATQAIVSVERAQLAMQLASQLRTKGVDALQDIFHTQV